jgi:hypothetical protein
LGSNSAIRKLGDWQVKELRLKSLAKTGTFLLAVLLALVCFVRCGKAVKQQAEDQFEFGPIDVARRVTSPNGTKTAILARSYDSLMDLNFALYVANDEFADVSGSSEDASFITKSEATNSPDSVLWIQRALWISPDYEPTTQRNWHEDVVWSEDGTVVAVTIEGQFVFAYDFQTGQQYEDSVQIRGLLE